jgi:hypothetical protein
VWRSCASTASFRHAPCAVQPFHLDMRNCMKMRCEYM